MARVERIVLLALEQEGRPTPPADERVLALPVPRYARTGTAFDHRHPPEPPLGGAAPAERQP